MSDKINRVLCCHFKEHNFIAMTIYHILKEFQYVPLCSCLRLGSRLLYCKPDLIHLNNFIYFVNKIIKYIIRKVDLDG